ncbi:MAG: D-2-hydroxyacid dehydrogenase [Woeseiaceae bacterium]
MPAQRQALHLHIDNCSALGDIFEITPERYAAAASRHADVAAKVSVSIANDGDGFAAAMKNANVLFAWDFDRSELNRIAPELELIQIQGAGINHLLPLDWLPGGITLTNSSGAHGARASEYLIMSVLALNCGLPAMTTAQRNSQWAPNHNSAIAGKTLLIYGVGAIGGALATQARKFDLHVIGIRQSGKPHADVHEMHAPDQLHELLPRADFVAVTAPNTNATRGVFGVAEFDAMKNGAGFIAYSRSELVDYDAMCKKLSANEISAIADVFDEEPLPGSSPYWQAPNLIITPHSSSNDPERHAARSLDILFDNLRRYFDGETLLNVVDPELQY